MSGHTIESVVYIYAQQGIGLERNSGRLVRMLEEDGWRHVATKGCHRQFNHPANLGRVTVPHPNKDIPLGTVASINRQAGWKARGT